MAHLSKAMEIVGLLWLQQAKNRHYFSLGLEPEGILGFKNLELPKLGDSC